MIQKIINDIEKAEQNFPFVRIFIEPIAQGYEFYFKFDNGNLVNISLFFQIYYDLLSDDDHFYTWLSGIIQEQGGTHTC